MEHQTHNIVDYQMEDCSNFGFETDYRSDHYFESVDSNTVDIVSHLFGNYSETDYFSYLHFGN